MGSRKRNALLTAVGVFGLMAGASAQQAARRLVLDTNSFWRYRMSTGTELARLRSGKLAPIHPDQHLKRVYKVVDGKRRASSVLRQHERHRIWPLPPPGWTRLDFDDRSWPTLRAPFCTGGYYKGERARYRSVPLLCLRGAFQVHDPARVGDLTLAVSFRGGLVAYLNGTEVARSHLPEGDLKPDTPAADYPDEVYVDDQGLLLDRKFPEDKYKDRYRRRERALTNVTIPRSTLRKGVNVLALQVHRAPAPEFFFTARSRRQTRIFTNPSHIKTFSWWPRIAVASVQLTAAAGAKITPNTGHTGRPKGFRVWNQRLVERVWPTTYANPFELLRPIRLCGARNGAYTGQVVVGSDQPITDLRAACSSLVGPNGARLPQSAARVRYGVPELAPRRGPAWFEGLEDHPPDRVPVDTSSGAAVRPVCLTVRVPTDTRPGDYRGTLSLSAEGQAPIRVPVEVHVVGWTLPDPKQFFPQAGMFQSPESVAMWYKLPLWSPRHWARVERSLELMGQLGTKTLYVTAIRQTHLGNQHGMIRYVRGAHGSFSPDFSVAEKYVRLAVKHLGKVPTVGVYCWETFDSGGKYHFGHYARKDRPILISVLDPETGALTEAEGPRWGTPECRRFWKPVFDGMRKLLARHDIADSMMAGVCGDFEPTEPALEDIRAASGGVKWISHSHVVRRMIGAKQKHPAGYIAAAWGGHTHHVDPDFGRGYGWKNPFPRVMTRGFPREPINQRVFLEALVTSRIMPKGRPFQPDWGLHGFGRMGADFWPVLAGGRGWSGRLLARYPRARWGQLNVALWMPALFAPGRDGAIPTVRSEMIRQNQQELAARIFIEKALHDKTKRARLGEDLAARAQELLDARVRAALLAYAKGDHRAALALDVDGLSKTLYQAAAEVARKLGD